MEKSTVQNMIAKARQYKAASYCFAASVCYLLAGQSEILATAPLKDDKPLKLTPANASLDAEFKAAAKKCESRTLLDRLKYDRSVSNDKFMSMQAPVAFTGTDACPGTSIPAGTSFTDTGNTIGANTTVSTLPIACTGYTGVAGPDHVYRFVLPALASRIATCSITVTPGAASGYDTAIYTLTQGGGGCPFGTGNTANNCVNGADQVFANGAEVITDAEMDAMPAGIYYLFIDSFYTTAPKQAGPYTLNFVCTTLAVPTAAGVSVGGRVVTADGAGIRNTTVTLTDSTGAPRTALTNAFGYYRFDDVEAGGNYILSVSSKQYTFDTPVRSITVNDQISDADFVGSIGK